MRLYFYMIYTIIVVVVVENVSKPKVCPSNCE